MVTKGLEEPSIPLVDSVKDQHLLKPPPSMESSKCSMSNQSGYNPMMICSGNVPVLRMIPSLLACGFGRRASDGGANLQQKEKQQQSCEGGWSHPSSREQLSTVSWIIKKIMHALAK